MKELRAALLRPSRGKAEPIGLEGLHLVQEAAQSGLQLTTVFVAEGHEALLEQLRLSDATEILLLPAEILASAVTTEAPQPIAALALAPSWTWEHLLVPNALLVVLAGLQDPGNFGAILRSAEAFGAAGVIALPGTVSPWNPKAMRASAGSVFRLPLLHATEEECFRRLRAARIQTIAAMPHQASPLHEHALHYSTALVIGSEGSGIPASVAALCTARVTIPTPGPVESLNAAVAASVLLYEASRQRGLTGKGREA
ncbi:MAG TPA: RNA methyltransferase [Acidobacteriaceae bacterium]|nr:RNA methyltransferase [Acidobacteriaceae bacterium]